MKGKVEGMKFSVALCTYNGDEFLGEQLASFVSQNRLPDEVVICDDGSDDNTMEILQDFASKAPFQTHVHRNRETLGSTGNFEKAIRLCSGDIIALSDQDDVWHPQKLSQIEQIFLRNPDIGGVFTDADVVDQNLKPFGFSLWDSIQFSKRQQRHVIRGEAFEILLKHPVVTGATLSFRSLWRERLSPFPSFWVHDAWIAFNLSAFSTLTIIQENLIQYRQHGNNQIGAMPKGIKFRINETLTMDRKVYYASDFHRYQFAFDHLLKWFKPNHEIMKKLSSKMRHLKTRGSLPAQRALRIPIIFKELITGNYHRFSVNWQVAIRDLLIP